jgi:hypothetical protein
VRICFETDFLRFAIKLESTLRFLFLGGLFNYCIIWYSFLPFTDGNCRIFTLLFDFIVAFDLSKDYYPFAFGFINASVEVTFINIFLLLLLFDWLFLIFSGTIFFLLAAFELFLLYVTFNISNELKLLKFKDVNYSFVIRSHICTLHNFYNKCFVDKFILALEGILRGIDVSLLISSV